MSKVICKELNKAFDTKAEAVKAVIERYDEIVEVKKSAVKFSEPSGFSIQSKTDTLKDMLTPRNLDYGDKVFPVINTTNYLDSHVDVHLPGIWKKSIKEQQGKIFLIINHDLEIGKVVSQPKDVRPFTEVIPWKDLGANFEGDTEALIFEAKLSLRSNVDGFNAYKFGDPVQHSVRMIYDKLYFCVDPELDDEANSASYNDNWEKYFKAVVNADVAKDRGYFWAVPEARIFKEGSMVLAGSNDITPTIYSFEKSLENTLDIEPQDESTHKAEAERLQRINYLLNL